MMTPTDLENVSKLLHGPTFTPAFTEARVLVEIGKADPIATLPLFEIALTNGTNNAQCAAVTEITELYKIHPHIFSSLLNSALEHENPNVQWSAALAISKTKHPEDKFNTVYYSPQKIFTIDHENIDDSLSLLESALQSNNENLEWHAMLELIDLASLYPQKVIPIIENTLGHQNPHVQWVASLILLKFSHTYPNTMSPFLKNITEVSTHARVLIELGKNHHESEKALKFLETGLKSHNYYLRWAALHELIELGIAHHTQAIDVIEHFENISALNELVAMTKIKAE